MGCRRAYRARTGGGASKLHTWRDGLRILRRMLTFLRLHRPLLVFGALAAAGAVVALALAAPVISDYIATGLVPRLPTALLATAVMLASIIVLLVGVVVDAQARYFSETTRLAYLAIPPPPRQPQDAAG